MILVALTQRHVALRPHLRDESGPRASQLGNILSTMKRFRNVNVNYRTFRDLFFCKRTPATYKSVVDATPCNVKPTLTDHQCIAPTIAIRSRGANDKSFEEIVMSRIYRALTLALFSLFAVVLTSSSSPGAMINFVDAPPTGSGTDFQLESITALTIDGASYNVQFHHGVSFDSLAGAITFSTPATAISALDAIVNFINSEGIDASTATAFTSGMSVPFNLAGPVVQSAAEINLLPLNPLTYSDLDLSLAQLAASPLAADSAYATFTAVPEPNTFLLGILTAFIVCGCRRPRRCSTAD